MEWVEPIVSAILGAVLGAGLGAGITRFTMRRNAQRSEQGRVREEARQRLAAAIRLYHAQVATARTPSTPRTSMEPNPFSFESRLGFAREVESELVHLDARNSHIMRGYLERLVGPVRARMGKRLAYVPVEQHTAMMQTEAFMESARSMSESEINDSGLLGIAGEAGPSHADEIRARDEAAAVLAEMARSLNAHG
ncbi:hypothetical protein [Nocardioides albus]|uniref:Uncharacterized protein n=1 Tax=Nocardioides albus TaxID=1841 RepID=A0A7W5A713_9ACTN|nr:hypothetical protein [Nocardioides albus]MBB3090772.1 hypothetical protein [Nocardioides albus]GGU37395.1 hypothetical protein GCM10007979_40470 [Nocardioides albus]